MSTKNKDKIKLITKNKKAYFDYEMIKTFEAWIELKWYEVKSIREGHVNLKGSYVSSINGQLYIKGMHITHWKALPNRDAIAPDRERKVFLHKKDILYLTQKILEAGNTILVCELYFKWQLIKAKIALAKGRKKFEKKQVLKERTLEREAKKAMQKYY